MPLFERANLFRPSGPEATLNYLWGRLRARDLSQPEALAMLSALHRELARTEANNRSIYLGYSRFMEALRRQMPTVHDYVVAEWTQSHYANRRARTAPLAAERAGNAPVESASSQPGPAEAQLAGTAVHGEAEERAAAPAEDDEPQVLKAEEIGNETGGTEGAKLPESGGRGNGLNG